MRQLFLYKFQKFALFELEFLSIMHILLHLYCTDAFIEYDRTKQEELMRLALTPTSNTSQLAQERMWQYFRPNQEKSDDPCTWRGVECVEGTVHSFVFVSPSIRSGTRLEAVLFRIDMRWLPNTLQYAHLEWIILSENWRADLLPRELRYLCLASCALLLSDNAMQPKSHRIDLQRLPQNIEEFYVFGGGLTGTIIATALPASLRICVMHSSNIRRAIVYNEALPEHLSVLEIGGANGKIKITEARGNRRDPRIKASITFSRDQSAVCSKYSEIGMHIRETLEREVNVMRIA